MNDKIRIKPDGIIPGAWRVDHLGVNGASMSTPDLAARSWLAQTRLFAGHEAIWARPDVQRLIAGYETRKQRR